ncbi:hypothetical protein SY88_02520 [Clostridiales bacterium PH28_bin88]|nr:hypothetical protein SY88_02520 [Clostridiales bacterium PH28_bin88]
MDVTSPIKGFALAAGADLVGVAPVDRLSEAPPGARPEDSLKGARTVVSLAVRIPDGLVGETRGTNYLHGMVVSFSRLDVIAQRLAVFIEENGFRAVPVPADTPYDYWEAENMYGRGNLSHKHAAQAAGLGVLGKNTLLITPRYGNRVSLVSVITDADLEPDPLVSQELCPSSCKACLRACPVGAIGPEGDVSQHLCRSTFKSHPRGWKYYDCWECRKVCPAGTREV